MRKRPLMEWMAVGLPTAATVFFWLMIVGDVGDPRDITGEGLAVLSALIALTAGTAVAWLRKPSTGALALIGAGAYFATIIALTAGRNVLAVAVILPLPWVVGGVLLLAAWAARATEPPAEAPS